MGANNQDGQFEIKECPMIGHFNKQRFNQYSPEDSANWYVVQQQRTKKPTAMYPTMGRAHINYNGFNQLIFGSEPREIYKSIAYAYVIIGNSIFRVDGQYNIINITASVPLATFAGPIYFAYLVVFNIVFACFVDEQHIYIYREDTGAFGPVSDPIAPGGTGNTLKPGFIAAFGNRIAVSVANSSQFFLSLINLGGNAFNLNTCFTNATGAVFAQENGIIRQMGVLNNQLYIFCDFTTGVWSNTPALFQPTGTTFPWKKNSSYDWNYGIANPSSLDIDFGRLVFLAKNSDGLLQFMISYGNAQPELLSTKAIDTLLQDYTNRLGAQSPLLSSNSNGFLFQYEDTVFYRFSGGDYHGDGILDQIQNEISIEYNFDIKDWHRCIELNGERNRIQYHVFYNFKHLVSVIGENTIYDMSGQYYFNEIRNPNQDNPQAPDAYLAYPFRYERTSPIISEEDYSEFETEYVEIDFVFGESDINFSTSPYANAQFLIAEQLTPSGQTQYIVDEQLDNESQPVFMLLDNSNTPSIIDKTYNNFFNPTVELYFSDDGGTLFTSSDQREFSQMGVRQWKMRWYQLGCSRNRVYRLICVSAVPIVPLGAVMNVRRVSGGAN